MTQRRGGGKSLRIERDEQWEALLSPIRVDLVEYLRLLGPSSATDLAHHMGRPADSLYYHLRKLEQAGIVEKEGERIGRGNQAEMVFHLCGESVALDVDPATGRNVSHYLRLLSAILRMTDRGVQAAFVDPELVLEGERRDLYARREVAWLTPLELSRVYRHLDQIRRILEKGRASRKGQLYSLTTFLLPMAVREAKQTRNVPTT